MEVHLVRIIISLLAAFFILVPSVAAQLTSATTLTSDQIIAEARRRVVGPPKATKLNQATVTVPMVGSKTLPLLNVTINGKGPYRFLLDTGASVTLLQMRVADELKLPVLRPGDTSKLLAAASLEIGGARFEDLVVGASAWDEQIDGVIGFNLFADCLFTMDYPRQRLSIRKGSLPRTNGKDIFTYGLDRRCPTLDVRIGGTPMTFLIDTGAAQSIVIPEAAAATFAFVDGLRAGPALSTFNIAKSSARVGRYAGDLALGIHIIASPSVYVWADEIPVIGSALLQDFILTFDQKNRTVKISV
jgi:predicted aspartyl protease